MIVVEEADFELYGGSKKRRILVEQLVQVKQAGKYEGALGIGAINSLMNSIF